MFVFSSNCECSIRFVDVLQSANNLEKIVILAPEWLDYNYIYIYIFILLLFIAG